MAQVTEMMRATVVMLKGLADEQATDKGGRHRDKVEPQGRGKLRLTSDQVTLLTKINTLGCDFGGYNYGPYLQKSTDQ